jgi:hypothetical protein
MTGYRRIGMVLVTGVLARDRIGGDVPTQLDFCGPYVIPTISMAGILAYALYRVNALIQNMLVEDCT